MYLMPAEFEPLRAVWLIWPENASDWPGRFKPIPWVFAEMARLISQAALLRIVVKDEARLASLKKLLSRANVSLNNLDFVLGPSNRSWARDCLPAFVRKEGELRALDFRFNAWAKYPDYELDDALSRIVAKHLGLRREEPEWSGRRMVLEGGAIDVNGQGSLLTTEECLLDEKVQCRNPGFTRGDYEVAFAHYLGASQVIWLKNGVAGDDTHGHVDDICRFVNQSTVVLCCEPNQSDFNHAVLRENRERLQGLRLANGKTLEIVDLPMPEPVYFEGQRLPASYANFLIANDLVLVPVFNDANDRVALGILAELFPGRKVIGLGSRDLIWGLGAVHCLTHEEPV